MIIIMGKWPQKNDFGKIRILIFWLFQNIFYKIKKGASSANFYNYTLDEMKKVIQMCGMDPSSVNDQDKGAMILMQFVQDNCDCLTI